MSSPVFWPMASSYFTGSPSPVRDVSYSITGTKGSTTYYYWVVANYTWGSVAPRAPLIVSNSPDVLGVTGSIVLSWIQPSAQIVSYTVFRTTVPVFPGTSTNAVGSATLTVTTITDSGAALVAGTFTAIPAMKATLFIDGTGPTPVLVTNVGMQVAGSLSATSFGTVGASEGTIPGWKTYAVTLVGSNWQVTGSDGSITLVPTVAALNQDILLGTLPANAYVTFYRVVVTGGPCTGTTSATIGGLGFSSNPLFLSVPGISLQVSPSNTTFIDNATAPGNVIINTPIGLTVRVTTVGGNVSAIVGPCSFTVSVYWGVTQ